MTSRWIRTWQPRPAARVRLLCLHHAGGTASSYRLWSNLVPESVDVCAIQLPGREQRINETPFTRLEVLVTALAAELRDYLDLPFTMFGHSMGALVAFELSRELRRHGCGPVHLFVSSSPAPHLAHLGRRRISELPDPAFVNELRRLNGTPDQVLADSELMAVLMPMLRADFELVESYGFEDGVPLDCPISVFGGTADPTTDEEGLTAWRTHTKGTFRLRLFPGDHFFVNTSRHLVARAVIADLTGDLHVDALG
ncbi:MAG: thioesterase II family protein [Actinomycetota bacterium]